MLKEISWEHIAINLMLAIAVAGIASSLIPTVSSAAAVFTLKAIVGGCEAVKVCAVALAVIKFFTN